MWNDLVSGVVPKFLTQHDAGKSLDNHAVHRRTAYAVTQMETQPSVLGDGTHYVSDTRTLARQVESFDGLRIRSSMDCV